MSEYGNSPGRRPVVLNHVPAIKAPPHKTDGNGQAEGNGEASSSLPYPRPRPDFSPEGAKFDITEPDAISVRTSDGSRVKRNIIANYLGTGITVLVPIVTLPFYLNALGSHLWGLVSFVGLLVGMLGLLDAGVSQAMVKQFATRTLRRESDRRLTADLLFGYERIYWVFALLLPLAAMPFVGVIVTHWLKLGSLPPEVGNQAIYSALILFFVSFPASIYRTVLSGIQEQVLLNKLMVVFILIRHGVGIPLILLYPSLTVYLTSQIGCALVETFVRCAFSWRCIGIARNKAKWNVDLIRSTAGLSFAMAGSVMLGLLTMSVDKLYLSAMLPIEQLGAYSIASNVAMSTLRLVHPIHGAIQPRLVELRYDRIAIRRINFKLLLISIAIFTLIGVSYFFFGNEILRLWLRNKAIADSVYCVLGLLLIGSACNAVYNIGYMNWIAAGQGRKVIAVNVIALLIAIGVTPFSVTIYGVVGAAAPWVILNILGVFLSGGWMFSRRANA